MRFLARDGPGDGGLRRERWREDGGGSGTQKKKPVLRVSYVRVSNGFEWQGLTHGTRHVAKNQRFTERPS